MTESIKAYNRDEARQHIARLGLPVHVSSSGHKSFHWTIAELSWIETMLDAAFDYLLPEKQYVVIKKVKPWPKIKPRKR
jgi:hypothetical protein